MKTTRCLLVIAGAAASAAAQSVNCDLRDYKPMEGLNAEHRGGALQVSWQGERGDQLRAAFTIRDARPLITELAVRASGGAMVSLTDDAIIGAWRELAREEGVFCEPASAAGLAALDAVELEPGSTVVCVITGHGLKDPQTAAQLSPEPVAVDPDPDAIEAASR